MRDDALLLLLMLLASAAVRLQNARRREAVECSAVQRRAGMERCGAGDGMMSTRRR